MRELTNAPRPNEVYGKRLKSGHEIQRNIISVQDGRIVYAWDDDGITRASETTLAAWKRWAKEAYRV